MAEKKIVIQGQWQLRHAAGTYWLLDMGQEPGKPKEILSLNQVGAELWRILQQGTTGEAAAEMLCLQYGLDREEALRDVQSFFSALEAKGILVL